MVVCVRVNQENMSTLSILKKEAIHRELATEVMEERQGQTAMLRQHPRTAEVTAKALVEPRHQATWQKLNLSILPRGGWGRGKGWDLQGKRLSCLVRAGATGETVCRHAGREHPDFSLPPAPPPQPLQSL